MDIIVEIWDDGTVIETYVGCTVYINHKHKSIRINSNIVKEYVDIECDHTHRHYTVYIGK